MIAKQNRGDARDFFEEADIKRSDVDKDNGQIKSILW